VVDAGVRYVKTATLGFDGDSSPSFCSSCHSQLKRIQKVCRHENAPEADFCLGCKKPLSLKASLELEKKERELLKLMTPETIEQFVQKKIEEILANTFIMLKDSKGGDRNGIEFRSVQELVDHVRRKTLKRTRKILEENGIS